MTAERHMVTIETERTGRITLTPAQFDMMLECALVALDGHPDESGDADTLHDILEQAAVDHAA